MFFVPRVNVVQSDSGYSVEVLGRTGMKYREGEKSMLVDSEVLSTGKGIQIFTKSIKEWDPPHHEELISPEKKAAIVDNIRGAIQFQNQPLVVD
jgi:hypothetical protein